MKILAISIVLALTASGIRSQVPQATINNDEKLLLKVKRIYVSELTGGTQAAGLRELIIASLNSTKLFVLTDNIERADAVLKGAADDRPFSDVHSFNNGSSAKESAAVGSRYSTLGVIAESAGLAENEGHMSKEQKHEAYAAVRLCNKDGDVLWSTTQESLGAKFRGASADVAAKIARQIALDYEHARRAVEPKCCPIPPME